MANPWFRLYHEFAHDPKVQRLSETDQRRYIMLLCMRCCNGDVTLQDEDVTFTLRIPMIDWIDTKVVLLEAKLIDKDNKPTAWEKRQYKSDSSAARVAKHRTLHKVDSNGDVTLQKRQSNVLEQNRTDTEQIQIKTLVAEGQRNCPHEEIIKIYHEELSILPSVKIWNDQRRKLLQSRWKEDVKRQDLDYWRRFFRYVSKSDYLTGKINGFTANLEWLCKSSNFVKVIEGNYENKEKAA